MLIKKLYLVNFRSYTKKTFEFSSGITLVVGANTTGKSNLLEAIFLLSFGKSPRAELDREMVRGEEKLGFVHATIVGSDHRDLEVVLTETGKRFRVNGVDRRLSDFSQYFHVVLFSPEDLNLVIGSPDLRRRFLDFALGSVDPRYARASTEFDQVRKRRNRLLEKINRGEASDAEMGFWDAKFLETGVLIQDKRKEFFNEINSLLFAKQELQPRATRTALATSHLLLAYLPSGLTAERLREYRPREIAAETSLIGPHRDDFQFVSLPRTANSEQQERNLATHGSRGEQRRAVLFLKKAELEFVERRIGDRPVLLLDDIFSELDKENRALVFDLVGRGRGPRSPEQSRTGEVGQTIITTTDLHHVPASLQKDLPVINL